MKVQLWDTAGQEKYKSITINFFRGTTGALIAFSLDDKKSLENVITWANQLKTIAGDSVFIVLVGNKCDLSENKISKDYINLMIRKLNVGYFETSAKSGKNVEDAFMFLFQAIKIMHFGYKNTTIHIAEEKKCKINCFCN